MPLDFMTGAKPKRLMLFGLLCMAFIARCASAWFLGDRTLENEYTNYVQYLINGKGFSYFSIDQSGIVTDSYLENPQRVLPSAFKPPIYPLFVAAFGFLWGLGNTGIFVVELFQALIGTVSCWLIYAVARMKFDNRTAIIALLLSGVYPLMVYSPSQISDATLQIFLICLLYWLLFRLEQQPGKMRIALQVGVAFGVLLLARAETWLYLPFIFLWFVLHLKEWKGNAVVVLLISLIIVAPWAIRNYRVLGTFTLNTSGGFNLWEGQNPNATGLPSWYMDSPAKLSIQAQQQVSELSLENDYEVRLDNIYFREARQFILQNPSLVFRLEIRKAFFYWTSTYPGIKFRYPNVNSPFYWLPWLTILPFFFVGILMNLRSFRDHMLFYAGFFISTLTVTIFFVLPRYIVFILPWAIIYASSAISRLASLLIHTTRRFGFLQAKIL